jgi:hypothetical protein
MLRMDIDVTLTVPTLEGDTATSSAWLRPGWYLFSLATEVTGIQLAVSAGAVDNLRR